MDIDKIKERLAAMRPDSSDHEDPEIAELLALVEEDLELADWFAEQQVFDRAFTAKLNEIEAPADLEEKIIAAMASAKTTAEAERDLEEDPKTAPTKPTETAPPSDREEPKTGTAVPFQPQEKRAWWQNPGLISMAAAIVLLLGFSLMLLEPSPVSADPPIDQFFSHIQNHHLTHRDVNYSSGNFDAIAAYLLEKGAPIPQALPPQVETMPRLGCSILRWNGELVSVIRMEASPNIDLYVVRRGLFPEFAHQPQPNSYELEQVRVLGWTEGDAHHFLVHTGAVPGLNEML